ncbi:MAG: YkgJ family cysteine cluster protein [Nanoarchaeota archaeon]
MQPFQCYRTGKCCTNIKGKNGFGLLLFDTEATEFLTQGKNLGHIPKLEYVIKLEPKTKTKVIILIQLAETNCPFLNKENMECRIYEKRPLVCRSYPVQSTGLDPARPGRFAAGKACEGCQKTGFLKIIDENKPMTHQEIRTRAKEMASVFGDAYYNQLMVEQNNYTDYKVFEQLKNKGYFKPVAQEQLSEVKNWTTKTLAQFCRQEGITHTYFTIFDLDNIKKEYQHKLQ